MYLQPFNQETYEKMSMEKRITAYTSYLYGKDKLVNLKRLSEIEKLPDNWNNNGAEKISIGVIKAVRKLLMGMEYQPEIFPTACGTIQFEYDGDNNSYIEFEIGASDFIEVFLIDKKGESRKYQIKNDLESVEKEVKTFYA